MPGTWGAASASLFSSTPSYEHSGAKYKNNSDAGYCFQVGPSWDATEMSYFWSLPLV